MGAVPMKLQRREKGSAFFSGAAPDWPDLRPERVSSENDVVQQNGKIPSFALQAVLAVLLV